MIVKFVSFVMLFHEAVKEDLLCFYETMENFRLKERLGCEPSDDQLALSLKMSRTDLQSTLIECSFARERLSMSNVRLVMSIAQRYDNMGAEMADLVQVTQMLCIQKLDMLISYTCTLMNIVQNQNLHL